MNKEEIKTDYGEIKIGDRLYFGLENKLVKYFEKLQQENKELKEELEIEKSINEKNLIFIDKLEEENKQLKERIDKALNLANECEDDLLINSNWLKELQETLKGE